MAHILRLTDGTTTINLAGDDNYIAEYVPQCLSSTEILAGSSSEVTEVARIGITGATISAVLTTIRSISELLRRGAEYQKQKIGARVWVEFDPGTTGTVYRSEILSGKVEYSEHILAYEWATRSAAIMIAWTRRFYWEGPLTQIPLTGKQGTNNIAGLTIYNPNAWRQATTISFAEDPNKILDSGNQLARFKIGDTIRVLGSVSNDGTYTILATADPAAEFEVNEPLVIEAVGATVTIIGPVQNEVQIAAADVVGDLPAPPQIMITNNYNDADRAARVYIAHNVFSNPASLAHILEGESGTGGTNTADAYSSGGYYKALSWAVTTETELLDWTLSTVLLNACASNYFRLLLRLASSLGYSNLWLKVKIKMELTTIWESEWTLASNRLFELATVQLPSYLAGTGNIYPAHLVLYGKRATAGTHTLDVDYLQLSPLDGWRHLQPQGYNLGYEARLIDDMIDDYLYTDNWSTPGKFGNYYTASAPVFLQPNKLQWLYFLHDDDDGDAPINRTFSIKMYYRPRRCLI